MPGKVNPVITEATISVGLKVNSNTQLIANCASRGSLQINEFLPLIAFAILETIELLTNTDKMLEKHVSGIEANPEMCRKYFENNEMLITAFLPEIGYEKAEEIIDEYQNTPKQNFREFLQSKLGSDMVSNVLSPGNLMSLGFREKYNGEKG
jgi:aspartate ammonia-lyase